ncbi:MAG: orotate phosphoribosyltransferase [Trueperaceae bacterium]
MNVLDLYKTTGAYLEGHFLLASGRHSPKFLQSTTVIQHPEHAQGLGEAVAKLFQHKPDFVIGPQMGGVVLAHEVAKALGCRALFAEKDGGGGMMIREAFTVKPGETFIAVEDVMTTGGSLFKAIRATEHYGAICTGVGCIIDRGLSILPKELEVKALAVLEFPTYVPEECPLCKAKMPLVKV